MPPPSPSVGCLGEGGGAPKHCMSRSRRSREKGGEEVVCGHDNWAISHVGSKCTNLRIKQSLAVGGSCSSGRFNYPEFPESWVSAPLLEWGSPLRVRQNQPQPIDAGPEEQPEAVGRREETEVWESGGVGVHRHALPVGGG